MIMTEGTIRVVGFDDDDLALVIESLMVLPLMSVPEKSGAGLPISTANVVAAKAMAVNKTNNFFMV